MCHIRLLDPISTQTSLGHSRQYDAHSKPTYSYSYSYIPTSVYGRARTTRTYLGQDQKEKNKLIGKELQIKCYEDAAASATRSLFNSRAEARTNERTPRLASSVDRSLKYHVSNSKAMQRMNE